MTMKKLMILLVLTLSVSFTSCRKKKYCEALQESYQTQVNSTQNKLMIYLNEPTETNLFRLETSKNELEDKQIRLYEDCGVEYELVN
jgi:hypothetical protein